VQRVISFIERVIHNGEIGELADMIDRSVISKKHPDAQTPTKEQISTLKMRVLSSDSAGKPIGSKIGSIIQNILHYCTMTAGTSKSTCKNYGHKLGPRAKGDTHLCADCGQVIKGPQDLRKASPAASPTKENGDGSWR
jgi:hypothetical protein